MRVVEIDGQPVFCGSDVLKVLALHSAGGAYQQLAPDERFNLCRAKFGESRGGKPMVGLTESGLYKLIMRSDKPEAAHYPPTYGGGARGARAA